MLGVSSANKVTHDKPTSNERYTTIASKGHKKR